MHKLNKKETDKVNAGSRFDYDAVDFGFDIYNRDQFEAKLREIYDDERAIQFRLEDYDMQVNAGSDIRSLVARELYIYVPLVY